MINAIKSSKIDESLSFLTLVLLLGVFTCIPYSLGSARYIIYTATLLSVITFFLSGKKKTATFKNYNKIFLAILIYGMGFFVWVMVFGRFSADYYGPHLQKARIAICVALIGFSLLPSIQTNSNLMKLFSRILFFAVLLLPISLFLRTLYQNFYLDQKLIRLSFYDGLGATEAAYIVSIFSLFAIISLPSEIKGKTRWLCQLLIAIIGYATIMLTVTRTAILFFPFLYLLSCIGFKKIKYPTIKYYIFPFLIIICVGIFFNFEQINKRRDDALKDINNYMQRTSSVSSIGARLAMYQFGIQSGLQRPMGQSVEQRKAAADSLIQQDPFYQGIAPYMERSHLHNELIENFSLRGIWGLAIVLYLYYSMLSAAVLKRNILLFIMAGCIICYGAFDVVLNGQLIYICLLAILFSIVQHHISKKPTEETL